MIQNDKLVHKYYERKDAEARVAKFKSDSSRIKLAI